ncbi:MAG: transglutaminase domain-containing protein [Armatimonadetes bacterium]|nr:transglutaminase domain-containing protein [Armatimonadota bacterium]
MEHLYTHCMFVPFLALAIAQQSNTFDFWMKEFEVHKAAHKYADCEKSLLQALQYGSSEYAFGSLVWSQMNQDKTEAACSTAAAMYRTYGQTAYAMASFIDAHVKDGGFEDAIRMANVASRTNAMQCSDWTNSYLRDEVKIAWSLKEPAIYTLHWTIPGETFTKESPKQTFRFPIIKCASQTFDYRLSGNQSSRVVSSSEDETLVEIEGVPGQPVSVDGTATIKTRAVGARTIRQLARVNLKPAPASEIGVFYYGTEVHDPADPAIASLAKLVHRRSAVETMQAILDWRDKEMPYRNIVGGKGSHFQRIIDAKCGVCHDASYITAGLARANGIPAYVVGCYVLPGSGTFKDVEGSHGHICVKLPSLGWTDVEPLNRTSLRFFGGSNYLRFTRQEQKDSRNAISLQGYKVSGSRM